MIEDVKSMRMFIERLAEIAVDRTPASVVVMFLADAVDKSLVWWDHIPDECVAISSDVNEIIDVCPWACLRTLPHQFERACVFRKGNSKCKLKGVVKDKKIVDVMESI